MRFQVPINPVLSQKAVFLDSEGEEKIIEDVYLDMLVSVMDRNIEKTDDYEKRISDTYDIIRY